MHLIEGVECLTKFVQLRFCQLVDDAPGRLAALSHLLRHIYLEFFPPISHGRSLDRERQRQQPKMRGRWTGGGPFRKLVKCGPSLGSTPKSTPGPESSSPPRHICRLPRDMEHQRCDVCDALTGAASAR